MLSTQTYSEKELLQRIASGDEIAFAMLFNNYYNRIGAFVLLLTGNKQYAEEIVQEVFIKIWLKRSALPEIEQFNAYLYTTSQNTTINFLRSVGREIANRKHWEETTLSSSDETSPESSYYRDLIEQAVAKLPPQQRKVYLLSRDEGLKQAEIAETLSISLETVKKHMVLALKFIKDYLYNHTRSVIAAILICSTNF